MNIIITGGHSGLGLELTKKLLTEGHQLGLIIRNPERRVQVERTLDSEQVQYFYADLSDQEQVINVAREISQKWKKVDVLFNNAAVLLPEIIRSKQGNEMHYEVNTLAPYLLAIHLKEALENASSPKIINTVSDSMAKESTLDIAEFLNPKKMKKLFGSYLQSKLALTCLMNRLALEQEWIRISIRNVTPGANKTKMTQGEGMPSWLIPLRNIFFKRPDKGAQLLYDAAFDQQYEGKSGIFIKKGKVLNLKINLSSKESKQLLEGIQRK